MILVRRLRYYRILLVSYLAPGAPGAACACPGCLSSFHFVPMTRSDLEALLRHFYFVFHI